MCTYVYTFLIFKKVIFRIIPSPKNWYSCIFFPLENFSAKCLPSFKWEPKILQRCYNRTYRCVNINVTIGKFSTKSFAPIFFFMKISYWSTFHSNIIVTSKTNLLLLLCGLKGRTPWHKITVIRPDSNTQTIFD